MVTELRHLLEESVQHPPAEPYDTGAIVRRAHTRRRRHRLVAVGSALAVVAVAGAGYGVVRELTGGTGADKVAHTEPVGPVVHPGRGARRPGQGRHGLRVVREPSTWTTYASGNGRLYEQVTSDGRVLVSQATRRDPDDLITEYQRFGLQDPVTGELRWLPAPPGARYADDHAPSGPVVVAVRGDTVVWLDRERAPMPIDVYDLGTRTWSHLSIDTKACRWQRGRDDLQGLAVSGDRLYFVPVDFAAPGPSDRRTLWSMPLDGSGRPHVRPRSAAGRSTGHARVDRGHQRADSPGHGARPADGEEHSFDPQSGDRCNQLSLSVARGVIGLGEYCGEKHRIRDDRMHVVTTDGRPLVTLQGNGIEAGGVSRGFVTATAYGDRRPGRDLRLRPCRVPAGADLDRRRRTRAEHRRRWPDPHLVGPGVHERDEALRRALGRGQVTGAGSRRRRTSLSELPLPAGCSAGEVAGYHGTVVSSPIHPPQATPTPSGAPSVAISSCFTLRKIHTITLAVQIMNAPVRNACAAPVVKPGQAGAGRRRRSGPAAAPAGAGPGRAGRSSPARSAPPRSTGSRDRARRPPAASC